MSGETREPQQQRSREKFARIVQATATLLETTPYEELGTKRIAAEAGVSVGVLYRYFTDKEAVVASLVRDWLRRDEEIVERIAAEPPPEGSRALIDKLLAAYADRFRFEPGYRRVWFQGPTIAALAPDGDATDARIAARVHRALVDHYALPDTPESSRRTRLAVSVGAHLLGQAFRDDPQGDPAVLADAALMIDTFLFAPKGE